MNGKYFFRPSIDNGSPISLRSLLWASPLCNLACFSTRHEHAESSQYVTLEHLPIPSQNRPYSEIQLKIPAGLEKAERNEKLSPTTGQPKLPGILSIVLGALHF